MSWGGWQYLLPGIPVRLKVWKIKGTLALELKKCVITCAKCCKCKPSPAVSVLFWAETQWNWPLCPCGCSCCRRRYLRAGPLFWCCCRLEGLLSDCKRQIGQDMGEKRFDSVQHKWLQLNYDMDHLQQAGDNQFCTQLKPSAGLSYSVEPIHPELRWQKVNRKRRFGINQLSFMCWAGSRFFFKLFSPLNKLS